MKNILLALFIAVVAGSCTKNLDAGIKNSSQWVLAEWPNRVIPTAAEATLNINDGNKIGGKSFCNSYGGTAAFNGNAIQFSQIFGTKMFCQEVAEAENQFLADLESVNSGKIDGRQLSLMKNGQVIMVFNKVK
ncbi:MAG: META domain-containing protein [Pedobacter sp.]|nr:MAG: META domain-containing protein [Pedobacter sp.]